MSDTIDEGVVTGGEQRTLGSLTSDDLCKVIHIDDLVMRPITIVHSVYEAEGEQITALYDRPTFAAAYDSSKLIRIEDR